MIRLFIYEDFVLNVDNDEEAERLLKDPLVERELSQSEVDAIFGEWKHLASPATTTVDEAGRITFTLPQEYVDLNTWLDLIVRPERDMRLSFTDRYMAPDFPISDEERAAWGAYREKLRNLPATLTKVVAEVSWPEAPS